MTNRLVSKDAVFLKSFGLLALGLSLVWSAQAAERSPEELFRAPVVYRVPGMDAIRVHHDLVYQNVEGVSLKADVYLPRKGNRFPVVIFVHGGFPEGLEISGKESGQFKSWGRLVAASGMAAVV